MKTTKGVVIKYVAGVRATKQERGGGSSLTVQQQKTIGEGGGGKTLAMLKGKAENISR